MDPELKEHDLQFIKEHWVRIAALAWKGFQQSGPGAVVIFTKGEKSIADLAMADVILTYLALKKATELRPSLQQAIEKYEPEKQIVVDVVQKRHKRTYRLGMRPFPPDAFERLKDSN